MASRFYDVEGIGAVSVAVERKGDRVFVNYITPDGVTMSVLEVLHGASVAEKLRTAVFYANNLWIRDRARRLWEVLPNWLIRRCEPHLTELLRALITSGFRATAWESDSTTDDLSLLLAAAEVKEAASPASVAKA